MAKLTLHLLALTALLSGSLACANPQPKLIETLHGNLWPETGDDDLGTFRGQTVSIDGVDGFPDIGTTMSDLSTTPAVIDRLVFRIHADTDDPGLAPFYFGISWHTPVGEGGSTWANSGQAELPPVIYPLFEVVAPLAPDGNPWTQAVIDSMDISVSATWDQQNPFVPGSLTLRVFEHKVEVWGLKNAPGGP